MNSPQYYKKRAKRFLKQIEKGNRAISHCQILDDLVREDGFANWNDYMDQWKAAG